MRVLGFGSSHRRGQRGWTNPAPFRAALTVLQPDFAGDGASPSGGADDVFHEAAVEHFTARGLDPAERALRFPYDPTIDGPRPGGFFRRNERQLVSLPADLGIGGISGKVGERISSGSADMASRLVVARAPVVIFREDGGVEPLRSLEAALGLLQILFYERGRDPALRAPGVALKAFVERGGDAEQMLLALSCAREASRLGPWLLPIEATIRVCAQAA